MKIAVIGGAGDVGSGVCAELTRTGFDSVVVDIRPPRDSRMEYRQADARDTDALTTVLSDCEAVAHFGSARGPKNGKAAEVFASCTVTTFSVFEACIRIGIKAVTLASSINALGRIFGVRPVEIRQLPVTVDHPTLTTDPYSFGKGIAEEVARYQYRTSGISSVAVRLPAMYPESCDSDRWRDLAERVRRNREAVVRRLHREPANRVAPAPSDEGNPEMRSLWTEYMNLFTLLSYEQAAQIVIAASTRMIDGRLDGAHVFFASDPQNTVGVDAAALARVFYPEARWIAERIEGPGPLVDLKALTCATGWEPASNVPALLGSAV